MSSRFAALIAPIALLFGAGIATAAPHGGGGHGGHAAPVGHPVHAGGVYHGGYGGYGGYYHGYPYYYGNHNYNNWAVGIGIGFGLGYGYGGYGYPYYGGGYYGSYPYYAAYPDYTYATPAELSPSNGYYTAPAGNGNYTAPAASNVANSATAAEPAPATVTLIVPAGTKVWFDGKETGEEEGNRVYALPGLEAGKSQTLSVKVEMNGTTSQMRIPLKAGDKMTLDMRK